MLLRGMCNPRAGRRASGPAAPQAPGLGQLMRGGAALGRGRGAGRSPSHRAMGLRVQFSAGYGSAMPPSQEGPTKRVLRYPDGHERVIRYPEPNYEGQGYAGGLAPDSISSDATDGFYSAGEDGILIGVPAEDPQALFPPRLVDSETTDEKVSEVPDSPAEFLKMATSADLMEERRAMLAAAEASYKLLDGCPWLEPRPLYVMAVREEGQESGEMYTLRTKVARSDMEDDLSKALGRRAADGSALISVSEMKDGVPTFDDPEAAAGFADLLEADGYDVDVAEVDSHGFFRMVKDAAAVCVAFVDGATPPAPEVLSTVLRGQQRSLDVSSLEPCALGPRVRP